MVVLTDMPYQSDDYLVLDPDTGEKLGHWAFKNGYSEGDADEMDFAVAKTDSYMHSRVYKNNRYDGIPKETKWTYVKNGLDHAADFRAQAKKEGYDAFMLLYCSENRFLKGTPRTFATNFKKNYEEYQTGENSYTFSSYALRYVKNVPATAAIIGEGNLIIVPAGVVLLAGAVIAAIIIAKKRKKKS